MKTGAEIVDYKNFVAKGAESVEDFEKLRGRQIADTVDTNREILDDEFDEVEYDEEGGVEVEDDSPELDHEEKDDLVINGGTYMKHYHSYPFGIGTAPNVNRDNGVSRVKKFQDFQIKGY